jgi:excisionase family DNA binding protein
MPHSYRKNARPVLEDRVLTTGEVLKRLGISRSTLFRLLKERRLRARRLGRNNVFLGLDVERFEFEHRFTDDPTVGGDQ